MLVPADPADIVPGVGLVAEVTLLNAGVFLARYHHRDHVEVVHVMAGRRLMALRAFSRAWRGVLETCDIPGGDQMAGRTFPAEQVAVRAAVAVAGEAVEAVQALRPGLQMR